MCILGDSRKLRDLTDAQSSFSFHNVALGFLREDTPQQDRQGDRVRRTQLAKIRGTGATQVP